MYWTRAALLAAIALGCFAIGCGNKSTSGQTPAAANSTPASSPAAGSPPPVSLPPAASQPPAQPAQQPPPIVAESVTVPAGEHVSVRMIDSIDSGRNTAGQVFRASLYAPLVSHGHVIVPAGARVSVLLTHAKDAGRIKGRSALEVRLSRLEYRGPSYPIESSIYEEAGKARGKQTAVRTGVGAVAGAVIGALAGGGKGAAIGSVAGGGAGAGYQLFTHGEQVKIPSETVLTFRLEAPLRLQVSR